MYLKTHNLFRRPLMAPDGVEGGAAPEAPAEAAPAEGGEGGEAPAAPEADPLNESILGGEEPKPEGEAPAAEGDKPAEPVIPEAYDLAKAMPEGMKVDQATLDELTPLLKDAKIDQATAEKLAGPVAGLVQRALDHHQAENMQAVLAARKAWADELTADPEVGGANLEASKASAAKVLDTFFGKDFRQALVETGFGNNVHMMRGLVKIADAISEGGFHQGGGGQQEKSTVEHFYGDSMSRKDASSN